VKKSGLTGAGAYLQVCIFNNFAPEGLRQPNFSQLLSPSGPATKKQKQGSPFVGLLPGKPQAFRTAGGKAAQPHRDF